MQDDWYFAFNKTVRLNFTCLGLSSLLTQFRSCPEFLAKWASTGGREPQVILLQ